MELELKKERLENFEIAACIRTEQEESAENIVPDSLPDIGKLITKEGKVFVRTCDIREEKAEVAGVVEVTVVYLSENGTLKAIKTELPFQLTEACPKSAEKLRVNVWIEELFARTLNPRKWQVKCRLQAELTAYERREEHFCSCYCGENENVECLQQKESAMLLTEFSEKDFTYEDTLSLVSGHGRVTEVLLSKISGTINETKISGNKVSVKGIYFADFLLAYENGSYETVSYELPFAQLCDGTAAEEARVEVGIRLTGMDCKLFGAGENEQTLAISVFTHLDVVTAAKWEYSVLRDIYSTAQTTETEMNELRLLHAIEPTVRRQIWQDNVEIGTAAESILHISAGAGSVKLIRMEGCIEFSTNVHLQIIYRTQEGKILAAERNPEIKLSLNISDKTDVSCRAVPGAELSAVITGESIAVRVPVDFILTQREQKIVSYVKNARCTEDAEDGSHKAPSLILRRREAGETLWTLAKRYRTTANDILSANGCSAENDLPAEKLLLIPKRR